MNRFVFAITIVCAALINAMLATAQVGASVSANANSQKTATSTQSPNKVSTEQTNKALAESEMKKLQGEWQVIRWEDESGQPASADEMKDFTLSFEGDVLTMRKGKDDPGTKCQFRIDPTKLPKWIDLGMPAISADATVLEGIYSLEGDALSLCITSGLVKNAAPPRPTEFKTKPNEKYAVLVLTRMHWSAVHALHFFAYFQFLALPSDIHSTAV